MSTTLVTTLLVSWFTLHVGGGRVPGPIVEAPEAKAACLRLVTADGTPAAGLVVTVRSYGRDTYRFESVTDERGVARFDPAVLRRHPVVDFRRVQVAMVTASRYVIDIEPGALVAASEDLPPPAVVPDHGFVDIVGVDDADGAPLRGLRAAARHPSPLLHSPTFDVTLPLERPWRLAVALADHTSRGDVFHVHVDVPGSLPTTWAAVPRPRAQGEVLEHRVRLPGDGVEVALRIVGEDERPARRRSATIELVPDTSWFERLELAEWTPRISELVTDDSGWIVLRLPSSWRDVAFELHADVGELYGSARIAGVGPRREAHIVLGAPPVKLRGRVVDERGRPVAGARVEDGWTAFAHDDIELPSTKTGRDGRFELRASPRHGNIGWLVRADGYDTGSIPAAAAGTTVDVVLPPASRATVRGRVAAPVVRGPLFFTAKLIPGVGAPASAHEKHVRPDADGSFRFVHVRAGSWRFALDFGRRQIFSVDDVVVGERGDVADARLAAIDVTALVREQRILVLAPDGSPATEEGLGALALDRFAVGVRASGDEAARFEYERPDPPEEVTWTVPEGPVDVVIAGDGVLRRVIRDVIDPVTLRIEPAGRISVRPTPPPVLPEIVSLRARLVPVDGPPSPRPLPIMTAERGAHTAQVDARGDFRIAWSLYAGGVEVDVEESAPLVLALDPAAGDREVAVPIGLGALERALANLRATRWR